MPQTPTTYMRLVQPSEDGDADVWDTLLTALFLLVDAHDHTTNKGAKVPTAGLNIDAALPFNGQRATGIAGLALNDLGALLSTGAGEFFCLGGDAYWRSGGGVNVKITNGGALNMTTVGGFAGDYTSVGAEAAYVDAQDGYTFKQQIGGGVKQYAKVDHADMRLYEFKAHPTAGVPTNFVSIKSPTALAASYAVTMPGAVPASTLPLQMAATGVLTAGGSIALASGDNITVAGAGRFKRTGLTWAAGFAGGTTSGATVAYDVSNHYVASTGAGTYTISIPMRDNWTVTQVDVEMYGNAACLITIDAIKLDASGTNYTASANSTPGAAWTTATINNAALAAAYVGANGQNFKGYESLTTKVTFAATGGRVRRVQVTANEV